MARTPPGHLIDDDMRLALMRSPSVQAPGSLAGLTLPMVPSAAAPSPNAYAPPVMPVRRARPSVVPLDVGEYATRMAPPDPSGVALQTKAELGADLGANLESKPQFETPPEEAGTVSPTAEEPPESQPPSSHQVDDDPNRFWRSLSETLGGFAGRPYDSAHWQGLDERRDRKAKEAKAEQSAAAQRRLSAEEADPNSEVSQRARTTHVSMLRQLGADDATIAAFSAKDIKDLPKGNVMMKLAEMRAKAKATEDARTQKATETEEKRKYDEQQWAQRNAITSKQGLQRAGVLSGMSGQRMVDSALLHDDLARQRAAEAEQRQIDAEERKRLQSGKPSPDNYELPGTEVVNEQRLRQTVMDDVQRRKLEDSVVANRKIKEGLRKMEDIRARHGTSIDSGVTSEYEGARTMTVAGLSTLAQTGVINKEEFGRYKEMLPDITPSSKDAYRLLEPGQDPVLKSIQGMNRALGDTINTGLETLGGVRLSETGDEKQSRKSSGKVAPPPKSSAASVPQADGKTRIIVDGQRVKATPAQIAQLKADGVAFEVVE